jgi:hypothetical protein
MTVFDGIESELTDALLKKISESDKQLSEEEITHLGFEELYKILDEKIQKPVYSEESVNVTINLHKNENGMYEISEEDMLTLDNAMFAIE